MRNRYIRFFVSSTFKDMKMERNLLQDLFSELKEEYSKQNWQIDMIDLRWGISQEAGLDNKTMQICKEELKRCQELSPKPNFIILLGDRYGWMPLPEVVPLEVYQTLQMNDSEKNLFLHWYQLDRNVLPEGAYIMKTRSYFKDFFYDFANDKFYNIDYTNDDIWKREVEEPLSMIFKRNKCKFYGSSATEQEIEHGAFNVDDAQEHVFAYIRHLQEIPDSKTEDFYETDKRDEISSLERRIRKTLSNDNILSVKTNYKHYCSPQYADEFRKRMKKHICKIINHVISENSQNQTLSENQLHIEYALQEASKFIGRKEELEYIKEYLENEETDYGLWFQAPSGMGKSALLAKVVELYKDDYNVICRFCGTSELSFNAKTIFLSLYEDLWHLNLKNKGKKFDELFFLFKEHLIDIFSNNLSNISLEKPILLIVDSLDRVDDYNWRDFNTLKWLDSNKRKDIKIIISSTPEIKYNIKLPFIIKRELNCLEHDAWTLVSSELHLNNRRIDEVQMLQLSTIIENSDKSPIYLKTLGKIISRIPSWQDLSDIPSTLEGLIKYYFMLLASPSRHGEILVKHIALWLATAKTGIVEKEVVEMLALNEEYMSYLKSNSSQELEKKGGNLIVPPIIWTRLFYDLQPLLRQENKFKIQLITLFHPRIKQIVKRIWSDENSLYLLLYRFYASKYPERHALLEGSHYLFAAYNRKMISQEEFMHHMESNTKFIVNKKVNFPVQLMNDYDEAIYSANDQHTRKRLKQIKDQLYSIGEHRNPQDVKMTLRNMPLSSPLRIAVAQTEEASFFMEDILAYTPQDESIYIIGDIGKSPVMSQDGKVIASLKDNCYKIDVEFLEDVHKNFQWIFKEPIMEIQMDDDAHYIVARTEELCYLLDCNERSVVYKRSIGKNGWISLNGNGTMMLAGDSTGTSISYNILNKEMTGYKNILHAKISPSGRYMWYIYKENYFLYRYDFNTGRSISFAKLPVDSSIGSSFSTLVSNDEMVVVSCSNECCIAGNLFVYHFLDNENKDQCHRFMIHEAPHLPVQHPSMFIHRELPMWIDSNGVVTCIDNNHKTRNLGTIRLNKLQCLNGNFTIALSASQGRIFDFQKELKKFKCVTIDNEIMNLTGFNLSCSNDGTQIAVNSYGGHGAFGSVCLSMLRVNHGKAYSWSPIPENKRYYMSLPSNAISSDGKLLAVSVYTDDEIILIDTENDHILFRQELPDTSIDDNAGRMKFTADGKYLTILTGDFITPVTGYGSNIFVYDTKSHDCVRTIPNDYINETILKNDYGLYFDDITPSSCNRYLFLDSFIYDLIDEKFIIIGNQLDRGYDIISPSTLDAYAGINHYNLSTHKMVVNVNNKYLSAISPSGLYHYYIKDKKLYVSKFPECSEPVILRDNVSRVYPAFDDRYIYVLDYDTHYILFDTITRKDLQIATKGLGKLGIKVCAQGLIVLNSDTSMLSLFKPDERYGVNKPAFTTFVRRWNLKEKIQEEPTAICPMCGKIIKYDDFLSCKLKEYEPNQVFSDDWDNNILKNHHCPHCNAEIQFTPYIV